MHIVILFAGGVVFLVYWVVKNDGPRIVHKVMTTTLSLFFGLTLIVVSLSVMSRGNIKQPVRDKTEVAEMTKMDCACLLMELMEYNRNGELKTPQMEEYDTIFQQALEKGLRALERESGYEPGSVQYDKLSNGAFEVRGGKHAVSEE